MIVLETGEYWGLYIKSNVIYGAVHGAVTSADGASFSGFGSDYNLQTGAQTSSNFSGLYTSKSTISGTIANTGVTFAANYDASYDVPATVTSIVGTWSGTAVSSAGAQGGSVTIDTQGNFTGQVSTCRYTGRFTPRASGKAVFNLAVTFATSGCLFNGKTLNGIGVLNAGGQQLLTLALLPDGSNGFLAAATR